jgi:hypothetical protein
LPYYRVYFIDREGHVSRPPEIIDCANSEEAAEKAKQFIDGQDIEVWDGPRMVVKYPHK